MKIGIGNIMFIIGLLGVMATGVYVAYLSYPVLGVLVFFGSLMAIEMIIVEVKRNETK
jgi:hypothetical protein